jgi:VanZ family protein
MDSRNTIARWFWPFLLATVIFFASGRGEVASPNIVGFDKVAHFAVFGLLATLVVRTGCRPWVAVLLVTLYGLADEWRQSFTPGRAVEVADWVADTLGAITAVAIYTRWTRYRVWLEMPLAKPQPRVENRAAVVPNQPK